MAILSFGIRYKNEPLMVVGHLLITFACPSKLAKGVIAGQ